MCATQRGRATFAMSVPSSRPASRATADQELDRHQNTHFLACPVAPCSKHGSWNGFEHIREAGADHVFDYRDPDLAKKILDICPEGVDRAIEVEFGENGTNQRKFLATQAWRRRT